MTNTSPPTTVEQAVINTFNNMVFVMSNQLYVTGNTAIVVVRKKDGIFEDLPSNVDLSPYLDDQYIVIAQDDYWHNAPTLSKALALIKQLLITLLNVRRDWTIERNHRTEPDNQDPASQHVNAFVTANLIKIFGKEQAIVATNQLYDWLLTYQDLYKTYDAINPGECTLEDYLAGVEVARAKSIEQVNATTSENNGNISFVAMVCCLMEQKCPWKSAHADT